MLTVNCSVAQMLVAVTLTFPSAVLPLSQLVTQITGVIQLPGWTFSTVNVTVPVNLEPGFTTIVGLLTSKV
jgi:hypothetical protein